MATSRTSDSKTTSDQDAKDGAATPNTGATAMAEGSSADGAVSGFLGYDAKALQDDPKAAEANGYLVPAAITPTTFEGAQPPPGHVNDPTSDGHVGSAGA